MAARWPRVATSETYCALGSPTAVYCATVAIDDTLRPAGEAVPYIQLQLLFLTTVALLLLS